MRGLVAEIDRAHHSPRPRCREGQATQLSCRGVEPVTSEIRPTGQDVRLASGRQRETLEAQELEHGSDEAAVTLVPPRRRDAPPGTCPPRLAQPRRNGHEPSLPGLEADLFVIRRTR